MRYALLYWALFLGTLAAPLSALAAPPPDVRELWAVFRNGEIRLEWSAVDAENVDVYRIYYGQQSILENDGAYDDFIATAGSNTSFTMTELPPFPKIFLAVLAMNTDGEESESFVEEMELDLSSGDTDGVRRESAAPSPSRREREVAQQALLSAESRSPTEVVLTFSVPVRLAPEDAERAVAIIDETGKPLRVLSIAVEDSIVIAATDPQIPQRRYGVRASPVLTGERDGVEFPLDPGRSIVDFSGFGEEPPPGAPGVAVTMGDPAPAGEHGVRNVRTRFDAEGAGQYAVIVGWDAPESGEVASYAVTPISGTSPGKVSSVPPETRVVRFKRIPTGLFRVMIQPVAPDGVFGPSVIAGVDVGMGMQNEKPQPLPPPRSAAPAELAAPVPAAGGTLSGSGAGTLAIALIAGAAAGLHRIRRSYKKGGKAPDVL